MQHPGGAHNPSSLEAVERMTRKLMRPRPEWNALGPYIPKRWREALLRINKRFVLQYFPMGVAPGGARNGFWSVCLKLPNTKLLFKQSIMSLVDRFGRFEMPSFGMLQAIKRGMWSFKHQGMLHELDRADRALDAADQKRTGVENDQLLDNIMKSLARLNPSSRDLNLGRVCVPAFGGPNNGRKQTILGAGPGAG